MSRRLLVAGIGNPFFGDDGFGVEVARRLRERRQPDGVDVVDFGIRGLDLAWALLDGYAAAVLVDATPRGRAPGTLCVIEPDVPDAAGAPVLETHGMQPARVLQLVRVLGGAPPILRVVGCEPAPRVDDEMAVGLSGPVAAVIDDAVRLVESLVAELRQDGGARA